MDIANNTDAVASIEQLNEYIESLKAANRHLMTNLYASDEEITNWIDAGEVIYSFEESAYLLLFIKEHSFTRMYYYIADIEKLSVSDNLENVVCDVFFQKESDSVLTLIKQLEQNDFIKYSTYTKWKKVCNNDEKELPSGDYCVQEEKDLSKIYELICNDFDIYSDAVPELDAMEDFAKEHKIYSIMQNGCRVSLIVLSERGSYQTEEFIVVMPESRNMGIGKLTQKIWFNELSPDIKRYYAWIRDNNEASKKVHLEGGFTEDKARKITMKR